MDGKGEFRPRGSSAEQPAPVSVLSTADLLLALEEDLYQRRGVGGKITRRC